MLRKSGRPDLRWEGLGVGVVVWRTERTTSTPLPNPPPQGGREHTERVMRCVDQSDRNMR